MHRSGNQLLAVVQWLQSGRDPYPFAHTLEMMALIIAAQESRANGDLVPIAPILTDMTR